MTLAWAKNLPRVQSDFTHLSVFEDVFVVHYRTRPLQPEISTSGGYARIFLEKKSGELVLHETLDPEIEAAFSADPPKKEVAANGTYTVRSSGQSYKAFIDDGEVTVVNQETGAELWKGGGDPEKDGSAHTIRYFSKRYLILEGTKNINWSETVDHAWVLDSRTGTTLATFETNYTRFRCSRRGTWRGRQKDLF